MDEDAIRSIVRETLARIDPAAAAAGTPTDSVFAQPHASHYRYVLTPTDGPCLIEPAVRCNHCGYCESHGH
jgi:hypothetical protein